MKNSDAQQKLESTYFEMLENIHYSKITVSDIIRKAGISRTTFYRHYADIFDMHKKTSERLAVSIIEACLELILKAHNEQDYFDDILKIFNTQKKYILLISGQNGSRYFFEAMLLKAKDVLSVFFPSLTEEQIFRIRFMTVAIMGVVVRDILENRSHNPGYIEICKKILDLNKTFGGCYDDKC